jgi:uroporphyrinogen-III synthase
VDDTSGPLAGYTVGITAERRRAEFAAALERQGATVISGPAIRIVPLADDRELLAATRRALAAPLDIVVGTTGVGFRGWLEAAGQWDLAEPLTAAVGRSVVLARGPKVRGAIRAAGLRETWSPESESSAEVLEHLLADYDLAGKRIAVQLHGDPLTEFIAALRQAGAEVIEVPVYRWVPPEDPEPLYRLIEAVAAGAVDAVAFTSAPAAANFLATATGQGQGEAVRAALGGPVRAALGGPVLAACVGPVTAAPLVQAGIPVIQPTRSRLGALVKEIAEQLPRREQRLAEPSGR